MVKKLSALVLAGLFTLPAVASAGGGAADLEAKIDQLTRELNALKSEMNAMKAEQEEAFEEIDEKSEAWDLAARFKFSGDFRSRVDYNSAEVPEYYDAMGISTSMVSAITGLFGGTTASSDQVQAMVSLFKTMPASTRKAFLEGGVIPAGSLGPGFPAVDTPFTAAQTNPSKDYDNDSLWTNRLRLNMRVKATENMEFKGRLAMYKAWGMQNNPVDYTLMGGPHFLSSTLTGFDGARTRQPDDNTLVVDRAILNWNNIGGQPIWFSSGRRPTSMALQANSP
jgi:outer membrane murein-binding lipoprotein Lpp